MSSEVETTNSGKERLTPIARGRFGEPPLPEAVSRADRRSVWWPIPNSAREFQTRFASEELRPPTAYTQARPNSALPFSLAEQTWRRHLIRQYQGRAKSESAQHRAPSLLKLRPKFCLHARHRRSFSTAARPPGASARRYAQCVRSPDQPRWYTESSRSCRC